MNGLFVLGVTQKFMEFLILRRIRCATCAKNLPCKPTCPHALAPPVMAVCHQCGNKLRYDYTYFRDKYDNIFCSRECAEAYYDIQEYDWTESDIKHNVIKGV